jgi:beta-phosphoglucomutase-like phosphatase (HAD superfamily)
LSAHAIEGRFRGIVSREDVAIGKPHPEPYLKASAALGSAPSEVLALEDSHAGVASAHAAGCMTIMVPDLLQPNDDIRAKVQVVASLHDVLELLNRAS